MDGTETSIIESPLLHQQLNQLRLGIGGEGKPLQGRAKIHGIHGEIRHPRGTHESYA